MNNKTKVKNRFFKDGNDFYLEVITTKREKIYFLLDEGDENIMAGVTWYAMYCPSRKSHYLESRWKVKFHRLKMKTPEGLVTDHINRCTYDNRSINLRNVTVEDNSRNIRRPKWQTNPKKSKLGIAYISEKYTGNNRYFYVRYHNFDKKHFKDLQEAKNYLQSLKEKEYKDYGC